MAKIDMDILNALKDFLGEKGSCFVAIVTDNGNGGETISVKGLDDTIYNNVRKRASEDGKKGLLVTPARGSSVIVGRLGVSDQLFIAMYSQIEEIELTIDNHVVKFDNQGLKLNVSSGKFEIKNNQENLKKLLQDLINEIMKITVTTPMGTSGTPLNVAQLQLIAQRISMLLR